MVCLCATVLRILLSPWLSLKPLYKTTNWRKKQRGKILYTADKLHLFHVFFSLLASRHTSSVALTPGYFTIPFQEALSWIYISEGNICIIFFMSPPPQGRIIKSVSPVTCIELRLSNIMCKTNASLHFVFLSKSLILLATSKHRSQTSAKQIIQVTVNIWLKNTVNESQANLSKMMANQGYYLYAVDFSTWWALKKMKF